MNKSKDSAMIAVVKEYMERTNRPFSPNDVFNNLNSKDSKLSKTAVIRALEELAQNQVIVEKANGKQKLYFADQSAFKTVDDNELKQIDQTLKELTEKQNLLRSETKDKEERLSTLKSSLTVEELTKRFEEIKSEVFCLEKRMKDIGSKTKDFDQNLNLKVKNERQNWVKEWRKRKRSANEMIDSVLEGWPNPKKALYEEMDIETDEEVNAIPPKI